MLALKKWTLTTWWPLLPSHHPRAQSVRRCAHKFTSDLDEMELLIRKWVPLCCTAQIERERDPEISSYKESKERKKKEERKLRVGRSQQLRGFLVKGKLTFASLGGVFYDDFEERRSNSIHCGPLVLFNRSSSTLTILRTTPPDNKNGCLLHE